MEVDPEDSQRPRQSDSSSPDAPSKDPSAPVDSEAPVDEGHPPYPEYDSSYEHPEVYPEPSPFEETEEEGGPIKSFLEHLEDLRWVFIKTGAALLVSMIICLVAAPTLIGLLKYPLMKSGVAVDLESFGPMGGFTISLKLGFYGGLVLALPFMLYFVGEFIVPALKRRERKYFLRAFTIGTGFFLLGLVLCYNYIMPISLRGLVQYNTWVGLKTETWRAEEYFEFATKFLFGVGLLFETPVVVLSLVRLGVIPHHVLIKGRSYMFIINFVFCAIITPADMVTTFIMAIVLQVCFEVCILISKYWEKQKEKKKRAEEKAERKP